MMEADCQEHVPNGQHCEGRDSKMGFWGGEEVVFRSFGASLMCVRQHLAWPSCRRLPRRGSQLRGATVQEALERLERSPFDLLAPGVIYETAVGL